MARSLGVVVDDMRLDAKRGIRRAAEMGFGGVELSAVYGETAPENLSATGRRHLARTVRDLGLNFQALIGDVGGMRFTDPARGDEHLDRTRRILELAADMGVPIVAAQIGHFDENVPGEQRDRVVEAVRLIADHADRTGTIFAIETTGSRPEALHALLKGLDCPHLRATLDPAELVMQGSDPLQAVATLANDIVLARVRDGLVGSADRHGRETPVGEGQVNLIEYLAALEGADYAGPATVRRTDTDRPIDELAAAKAYIESLQITEE